jgi:PhzF family phenazine biosynthesis protein
MGAYYLEYMNSGMDQTHFVVEQGHEIGRDGKVHVSVVRNGQDMDVRIRGTAVFVEEMKVELNT